MDELRAESVRQECAFRRGHLDQKRAALYGRFAVTHVCLDVLDELGPQPHLESSQEGVHGLLAKRGFA